MKGRFVPRAGIKLALVVLLMLGLLPAAPAAAQESPGFWTLTSAPKKIVRKGVAYQMILTSYDFGSGDPSFNVTLQKTLDPAGVRRSTQSHTFSFTLDGNGDFVHTEPKTLATAKVATARDMAPYGAALLRFKKTSGVSNTCRTGGKNLVAKGTLGGDFKFKTGTTRFGTITERPGRATLMHSTGFCQDSGPIVGSCLGRGTSIRGDRAKDRFSLSATRAKGSRVVNVLAYYSADMKGGATRSAMISATLPATKLSVANDLSTATIATAKQTYLSGTAKFVKNAALQKMNLPCGNSESRDVASRAGILKGTLRAGFWYGPAKSLRTGRMSTASAERVN